MTLFLLVCFYLFNAHIYVVTRAPPSNPLSSHQYSNRRRVWRNISFSYISPHASDFRATSRRREKMFFFCLYAEKNSLNNSTRRYFFNIVTLLVTLMFILLLLCSLRSSRLCSFFRTLRDNKKVSVKVIKTSQVASMLTPRVHVDDIFFAIFSGWLKWKKKLEG